MNLRQPLKQQIAVLSSLAGGCLTVGNWEKAGINGLCYKIDALAMKPGLAAFNEKKSLRIYTGWYHYLILHVNLEPNEEGVYHVRSSYDGQLISFNHAQLYQWIQLLSPNILLLPAGCESYFQQYEPHLSSEIDIYYSLPDKLSTLDERHHYYCEYESGSNFSEYLAQVEGIDQRLYLLGDFSLEQLQDLKRNGQHFIETDRPAKDGYHGLIYAQGRIINISEEIMRDDFAVIDEHCHCCVCQSKLTRAYLHHLFLHTPLLCQRFLIEHNIHYCIQHLP